MIQAIRIEGNRRIEEGTILSYMLVAPGDSFDPQRIDSSLRTLYATGLFQDVSLRREGNTLIVHVVENPIVNRIEFEGNSDIGDDALRKVLSLRQRAVFSPRMAEADRQKLLDLYAARGHYAATVEPQIIRLPQNRVNVVFRIAEGPSTEISRIAFVGNHAFSEGELREVIASREQRFWRIFSSADEYNPQRVAYDRELLRRFYLRHGYADVQVTSATAELAPDRKAIFLTFTIDEGARYRVGKVSVDSEVPKIDPKSLRPLIELAPGDWYNGDAVEHTATAMQDRLQTHGFPFVEVNPRIARDPVHHTVNLVFVVQQGERAFVERIEITGNTRTEDKVIRREFTFAEGDAFNAAALRRTKQRLQDLGYFGTVSVTTQPGSAPDRVIVNTAVTEKATGEITVGGGYSTDAGALGQVGLHERNLLGTGIDASINATLAQLESQIDLSVTDPYFLDRNLAAGFDIYEVQNDNINIADYEERRAGISLRLGYQFNEHLSQAWTYSFIDRDVYDIQSSASVYVQAESGQSLLSQLGQTFTIDYRDSRINPHTGFVVRLGTDVAGLGGDEQYLRAKIDGTYFIPLDYFTGNADWGISISAGTGYLDEFGGTERIIDRFFLGGDNLRGFLDGGAGPHSIPNAQYSSADALGGEFIYTESTELHFPLPISPDLGLSGRAFVDLGGLSGLKLPANLVAEQQVYDTGAMRVGAGVGVSWNSPFGLINLDIADPVVKKRYDQTQVFRIGFGTRF